MTANGSLKYLTIGTLLAVFAGAVSYGVFQGATTRSIEVNAASIERSADRLAKQTERCDLANQRIWAKISETQEKTFEQYQRISDKVDGIARQMRPGG